MARVSEPANYRASAADPADHTVLCAELPGSATDEWWSYDDASLGRLVAASLVTYMTGSHRSLPSLCVRAGVLPLPMRRVVRLLRPPSERSSSRAVCSQH